jgi:hypothetical protein
LSLGSATAAQGIELTSFLSGTFVQPATASTAFGSANVTYKPESNTLQCNLSLVGMNATVAHVHRGASGTNSPPLFVLSGSSSFLGGSFALDPTLALELLSEGFYIDAHSSAFPAGEVRGALRPGRYLHCELNGTHVVPPVVTAASARSWIVLDIASGSVTIALAAKGATPTSVQWRRGAPGTNGPLLAELNGAGPNWAVLAPPLSLADRIELLRGNTYIEVAGSTPPAALLRGQVLLGGLNPNGEQISASRGGRIELRIETSIAQASRPYFVLGTISGALPGLTVDGFLLPLNADAYFGVTLSSPNQPPLSNSSSFLSLFGQGQAAFQLQPGEASAFVGMTAHHALAVVDLFGSGKVSFTSNAVPLKILP